MKKLWIALFIVWAAFLWVSVAQAADMNIVLQWDENTEPDLATGEKPRYKIYMSTDGSLAGDKANAEQVFDQLVADDENDDPALVQRTIIGLDDTITYYIALTALDEARNESELSNEVITSNIDATPPDAPLGLRIWDWVKRMISKLFGGLRIV